MNSCRPQPASLLPLIFLTFAAIAAATPSAFSAEPQSRAQECLTSALSLDDCLVPALANSETDLETLSSRILSTMSGADAKNKKEKFETDSKIWKQHRVSKCEIEAALQNDDENFSGDTLARTDFLVCRLKLNEERIAWLEELSTSLNSSKRTQSFSASKTPKSP